MSEQDMIYIEWRGLYDGWLAKYNRKTGEFSWRDHHAVDRLSKNKKEFLKKSFLGNINKS